MYTQMYLHEAIKLLIEKYGPMTPKEIADRNAAEVLYLKGKGKGSAPNSRQIRARVNNYPNMFRKGPDGKIYLV